MPSREGGGGGGFFAGILGLTVFVPSFLDCFKGGGGEEVIFQPDAAIAWRRRRAYILKYSSKFISGFSDSHVVFHSFSLRLGVLKLKSSPWTEWVAHIAVGLARSKKKNLWPALVDRSTLWRQQ